MQKIFLIVFFFLLAGTAASGRVVYVDSSKAVSGDGSSWALAVKTLQEAVDEAFVYNDVTEIWVARGTYKPTAYPIGSTGGSTIKDYAFRLRSNLAIRGGFAGTETDTAQRVPGNTTIIDATSTAPYNNPSHLFIAVNTDSTARLDQLTLANYQTNPSSSGSSSFGPFLTIDGQQVYVAAGGGLYCRNARPTITNCVFFKISAWRGAGIYNSASSPRISGCLFRETAPLIGGGSGIYNDSASAPLITDCVFRNSYAGTPVLNSDIVNAAASNPVIRRCSFLEGSTYAIGNTTASSPLIQNCLFENNNGGIYGTLGSAAMISGCVFRNNNRALGAVGGGAINIINNSAVTVTNSLFLDNKSASSGGAIRLVGAQSTSIINCTFVGNQANGNQANSGGSGGAISLENNAEPVVRNCIVWGNTASVSDPGITAGAVVSYSDVQGTGLYPGAGNINVAPLFVDAASPAGADSTFGTADDGLAQHWVSFGVDAGYNGGSPTIDITGAPRPQGGVVDMGAYETGAPSCSAFGGTTVYVDSAKQVSGNGDSWNSAFRTVQEALVMADRCSAINEVWIKKGTYRPIYFPIGSTGGSTIKDYAFRLRSNLAIRGGFAGTETDTAQRVPGNTTIIDATSTAPYNNPSHLFIAVNTDSTARLDQLTLANYQTNPSSSGSSSFGPFLTIDGQQVYVAAGGGLYCRNARPTITNCVFFKISAWRGAGIYNSASSPRISGCLFRETAPLIGGGSGIYNDSASAPLITDCVFRNSYAGTPVLNSDIVNAAASNPVIRRCSFLEGSTYAIGNTTASSPLIQNCLFENNNGGIYGTLGSAAMISGCVFRNNNRALGAVGGGAINIINNSAVTVTNSLFLDNKSASSGGAIRLVGAQSTSIINCTFVGNQANGNQANSGGSGGAISLENNAEPVVRNCIVWGNTASVSDPGITAGAVVNYSDVQGTGLYPGAGNINVAPLFVDAASPAGADSTFGTADDGFVPAYCAPTINAGSNAALPAGVITDLRGLPRTMFGVVDMGAYEKQTAAPASTAGLAALSSGNSNSQPFVKTCVDGAWTYYAIPGNADSVGFAIAWNGNSAAAEAASISVKVDGANTVQTSITSGRFAMRRYWNVDLNGQVLTAPVKLRFFYAAADTVALRQSAIASGFGNSSSLRWFKTNSTVYAPSMVTPDTINTGFVLLSPAATGSENNAAWVQFDNITSFSGGTAFLAASGIPLPVKLLAFEAHGNPSGRNTQLSWRVASEQGIRHYTVQRSLDGRSFTDIGSVPATGREQYFFTDEEPIAGANYYRLWLQEESGDGGYSKVLQISFSVRSQVAVFPNPAQGEVSISCLGDALLHREAVVSDMSGREVYRTSLSPSQTFSTAQWPAGIYQLRLADGSVIRIVKQ